MYNADLPEHRANGDSILEVHKASSFTGNNRGEGEWQCQGHGRGQERPGDYRLQSFL